MANEPITTVTGNLTADPELRFTPNGRPVASFTIANTPRWPDKTTGQWTDGETWFVRCSAWGDLGENIAGSLTKGAAVVATGRLRARSWNADDGTKRTAIEMTVDDLGPSLRRATVKVVKTIREHAKDAGAPPTNDARTTTTPTPPTPSGQSNPWTGEPAPAPTGGAPGGFSDEPPF